MPLSSRKDGPCLGRCARRGCRLDLVDDFGNTPLHHAARINDRRLHLYSLELDQLWKLLLMARAFRAGTHGHWEKVRSESGARFEVITRRPRPVNADGELISRTPAIFSIKPRALRVRAPAHRQGEGVAPAPASV